MKAKVLSTKKLDATVIESAKAQEIEITEKEMISIEPVDSVTIISRLHQLSDQKVSIVLTSSNAAEILNQLLLSCHADVSNWNLYCLSGKTKSLIISGPLRQTTILGEANSARELGKKILESKHNKIIFFCGDRRRDELPDLLHAAGVQMEEVILYHTRETGDLVSEVFDAVLFFSPSAVESFFSLNSLPAQAVCFSIGETTSHAIRQHSSNKILTSSNPDQQTLINELAAFFANRPTGKSL